MIDTKASQLLVQKFFEKKSTVRYNIDSFNSFVEWRMQKIVDEVKEAIPVVIPPDVEEIRFQFGAITLGQPLIIEADGVERKLLPAEARLRNLTYAAPVFLEISLIIDGKKVEQVEVQIMDIPVMLKSKLCYLANMNNNELIEAKEDPTEPGNYFIISGTERFLVMLEDLAPNTIFLEKASGSSTHVAKVFSTDGVYKISHKVERKKDGMITLSFANLTNVPFAVILKALGITTDRDILEAIGFSQLSEDIYLNLYDFVEIDSAKDAQEFISKTLRLNLSREQKIQRVNYIIDNILLPHIGKSAKDRKLKAYYIGRMVKKLLLFKAKKLRVEDKDHYKNKRVRLSGDLLEDLFRANFKTLVSEMLYIFQRSVRRGKILPISTTVRTKLLTQIINSAMATGRWTGNKQGVSQRLDRENPIAMLSDLQRISSPLASSLESFAARALHPTQWGRLCAIESPEGKNIGLRKHLALLADITPVLKDEEINAQVKLLEKYGLDKLDRTTSDVYFNGKLIGGVNKGLKFAKELIEARRKNVFSRFLNVYYDSREDIVYLTVDGDRVIRPLIVVKNGRPAITSEHIKKLGAGEINWDNLIKEGVIEFLDASEEENTLVAITEEEITLEHTHLEINPIGIFGVNVSMVPFANYNPSSRLLRGQMNQKQGAGCYSATYLNRLDTNVNLLHYPQNPIVKSFTQDIFGTRLLGGQNVVIAILNYEGYNMRDSVVINRASLDRGFGRSTHYRPYFVEKLRYAGGQSDEICIPTKDTQGYSLEQDYRFLDEDGIISPEINVDEGEVLAGKTSPPRFLSKLDSFSTIANIRKDTSTRVKTTEHGVVSDVFITRTKDGNALIRLEVRNSRVPELGDKFSSRHGQKGVLGFVVPPEDVPFTASGIQPDIIFSPFGMRRMTVGHIIEIIAGKVGALAGRYIDGSSFQCETVEHLRNELLGLGFREDGTETLYDGKTGKEYNARIFIGNIFYMRLKHQVADKIQSRGRGKVALLTRQPTAGRALEGGLRFGEMEKETLVGHGASLLMKERFDSDRTVVYVCERCGDIIIYDDYRDKAHCLVCEEKTRGVPIEISYAFKLLLDELKSMGINTKLILKEKYNIS